MELLSDAFVYLCAAVIAVPIANRLGLGSVLGYLIAGVVIGPVLGIVGSETTEVQHFAEFGVVMMLFLVGLELQPAVLWKMRKQLIGLGGLQVVGTTAVFAGIALAFGLAWQAALALGMILALSSTAIVLQTLNEKGWLKTQGGQSSFSVLLTQDIAVIPMLAILPLLAVGHAAGGGVAHSDGHGGHEGGGAHGGEALAALPGWAQALVIIAVIIAIIVAGRHLLRPVFRFIAEAHLREIFTATALLLVIGIALLMDFVGLSPALGTFLAGVVLSDSDYRHELESDIEPFKGLLLGAVFPDGRSWHRFQSPVRGAPHHLRAGARAYGRQVRVALCARYAVPPRWAGSLAVCARACSGRRVCVRAVRVCEQFRCPRAKPPADHDPGRGNFDAADTGAVHSLRKGDRAKGCREV